MSVCVGRGGERHSIHVENQSSEKELNIKHINISVSANTY